MPVKGAAALLKSIFVQSGDQPYMASNEVKGSDFFIIPGQSGPRWIVPTPKHLGLPSLSEWHPYSLVSMVKWRVVCLAYAKGFLWVVPGVERVKVPRGYGVTIPNMGDELFVPVVYVGTAGLQQKAVVMLVSPENGTTQAIMKVALGQGARASMLREIEAIKYLADARVPGIPACIASEAGGERTWQSVVRGCLTGRKLTTAHIDWLLQMPREEKVTTFQEQRELLQNHLSRGGDIVAPYRHAVAAALKRIQGGALPLVFVHGDFVPWNLKHQGKRNLAAIDWEDAEREGLPLWDLCHFFFMQAHLFHEKNPMRKLGSSPLVQDYLKKMGVKSDLAALVLLYILLKATAGNGGVSEAYRTFLLAQIASVIPV